MVLRVSPVCHDPDFDVAEGSCQMALTLSILVQMISKNHKQSTHIYTESIDMFIRQWWVKSAIILIYGCKATTRALQVTTTAGQSRGRLRKFLQGRLRGTNVVTCQPVTKFAHHIISTSFVKSYRKNMLRAILMMSLMELKVILTPKLHFKKMIH